MGTDMTKGGDEGNRGRRREWKNEDKRRQDKKTD